VAKLNVIRSGLQASQQNRPDLSGVVAPPGCKCPTCQAIRACPARRVRMQMRYSYEEGELVRTIQTLLRCPEGAPCPVCRPLYDKPVS
jgi:hypothetical protein